MLIDLSSIFPDLCILAAVAALCLTFYNGYDIFLLYITSVYITYLGLHPGHMVFDFQLTIKMDLLFYFNFQLRVRDAII